MRLLNKKLERITWELVPMSGAGISVWIPMRSWIFWVKTRVRRSSSLLLRSRGEHPMPPFAPPYGRFTTAVFHVISWARALTSSGSTFRTSKKVRSFSGQDDPSAGSFKHNRRPRDLFQLFNGRYPNKETMWDQIIRSSCWKEEQSVKPIRYFFSITTMDGSQNEGKNGTEWGRDDHLGVIADSPFHRPPGVIVLNPESDVGSHRPVVLGDRAFHLHGNWSRKQRMEINPTPNGKDGGKTRKPHRQRENQEQVEHQNGRTALSLSLCLLLCLTLTSRKGMRRLFSSLESSPRREAAFLKLRLVATREFMAPAAGWGRGSRRRADQRGGLCFSGSELPVPSNPRLPSRRRAPGARRCMEGSRGKRAYRRSSCPYAFRRRPADEDGESCRPGVTTRSCSLSPPLKRVPPDNDLVFSFKKILIIIISMFWLKYWQ